MNYGPVRHGISNTKVPHFRTTYHYVTFKTFSRCHLYESALLCKYTSNIYNNCYGCHCESEPFVISVQQHSNNQQLVLYGTSLSSYHNQETYFDLKHHLYTDLSAFIPFFYSLDDIKPLTSLPHIQNAL